MLADARPQIFILQASKIVLGSQDRPTVPIFVLLWIHADCVGLRFWKSVDVKDSSLHLIRRHTLLISIKINVRIGDLNRRSQFASCRIYIRKATRFVYLWRIKRNTNFCQCVETCNIAKFVTLNSTCNTSKWICGRLHRLLRLLMSIDLDLRCKDHGFDYVHSLNTLWCWPYWRPPAIFRSGLTGEIRCNRRLLRNQIKVVCGLIHAGYALPQALPAQNFICNDIDHARSHFGHLTCNFSRLSAKRSQDTKYVHSQRHCHGLQ